MTFVCAVNLEIRCTTYTVQSDSISQPGDFIEMLWFMVKTDHSSTGVLHENTINGLIQDIYAENIFFSMELRFSVNFGILFV